MRAKWPLVAVLLAAAWTHVLAEPADVGGYYIHSNWDGISFDGPGRDIGFAENPITGLCRIIEDTADYTDYGFDDGRVPDLYPPGGSADALIRVTKNEPRLGIYMYDSYRGWSGADGQGVLSLRIAGYNVPGWEDFRNVSQGATVVFGSVITSGRTVQTDTAVTVKNILFDSANSYTIAGDGSVDLESDIALSTIIVTRGAHQFEAVGNLASDTNVNVTGGSTLAFNNALNLGGRTLTINGTDSGEVKINDVTTGGGTVVVTGGVLAGVGTIGGDLTNSGGAVSPGNSAGELAVTGNLALNSGKLSVEVGGLGAGESDKLVVTGTADLGGELEVSLIDGFVPEMFDEITILTAGTVTDTFDSTSGLTGLGGKAGLYFAVDYDYDANDVTLTASAQTGDATLDAVVDITDLGALAANWKATGAKWSQGDFTGEGSVDITDLGALAANWQFGVPITAIPEPATLVLLAIGGLALIRRRR